MAIKQKHLPHGLSGKLFCFKTSIRHTSPPLLSPVRQGERFNAHDSSSQAAGLFAACSLSWLSQVDTIQQQWKVLETPALLLPCPAEHLGKSKLTA